MTSAVRILGNIQLVYHTFYFNMTIRKLKLFPLIYFLILKSKISICNIFSIFSIIIRKTFYEDEIFLKSYMEKRIATLCINKKKKITNEHTRGNDWCAMKMVHATVCSAWIDASRKGTQIYFCHKNVLFPVSTHFIFWCEQSEKSRKYIFFIIMKWKLLYFITLII